MLESSASRPLAVPLPTPAAPRDSPLLPGERLSRLDSGWFARRGKGPYLLADANTRYVLETDVTTRGTAFVVGAAGITLDLNGHVVTYGDSDPILVRNGGFEEGEGRIVPGWDVSLAPQAQLADNTRYLFGKRVLRLEGFDKPQRIVSEPIPIAWLGRTHVASITPANPETRAGVVLSVLDARTQEVLGKSPPSNPGRGISSLTHFIPSSATQVRLQIDVVPPENVATSIDLDEATICVEGDHGILASRVWRGQLPGWNGLSGQAQGLYGARRAGEFALRNGKIIQGKGRGCASTALYFQNLPGVIVEDVETFERGMDSNALDATGAQKHVTIRRSIFRQEIDNISNRLRSFATLELNNIQGPIVVEDNRLLGCPQMGIKLTGNDPLYPVRVCRNEIRQNVAATNGYAILCAGLQNFVIRDNLIKPINGKGISLDSYSRSPLGPGEVSGNVVDVQERPNREYPKGLDSVALRLRNNVDRMSPQRGLHIHDNVFIARCGPGLVREANGVRISYVNRAEGMKDARIAIVNNTMRAVALSAEPVYRAKALVLDQLEAGVDLTLRGNRLESNDVGLALADTNGSVEDAVLISNVFGRSAEGAERPWSAILAGFDNRHVRNVRIIDARYEHGAGQSIVCAGVEAKEVQVGCLLDVRVVSGAGLPLSGASIELLNRDGQSVYAGQTDRDGGVRDVVVITSIHRQTGHDPRKASAESRGPFQIVVRSGEKSVRERFELKESQVMTVTIR